MKIEYMSSHKLFIHLLQIKLTRSLHTVLLSVEKSKTVMTVKTVNLYCHTQVFRSIVHLRERHHSYGGCNLHLHF
jgi:hypothetical protein